jgi:hypothetical protein
MKTIPAMKHILALVSLIAMLFVGCATTARHNSYEYRFVHGSKPVEEMQKEINELAKEGWRVSSFALGDNGHYKYLLLERQRMK